jgi:hypothetical protein
MSRTRICLYILILTPFMVYWQTVFHEYGLRDDYSSLREAREEPGKLVRFTASQGRPLYGALLETTFGEMDEVVRLPWLRLATVALLTVLGLAMWRQLYQSGWSEIEAAVIGLGIALLPAAQVTAGWANLWPHVLTLLLAVAGFSAIETELERGGLKRAVALLGGSMIYCLAGLIYQSNALFAVVPIAAVLLVRSGREPLTDRRWCLIHLSALIIGLTVSYLLMRMMFASGVFHQSPRMALETNPATKLAWFFWQPLPNALALFALRDDFNTGAMIFWPAALIVAALIGLGYKSARDRADASAKNKWLICVLAVPFLAHAVSLIVAERSIGYRTLFALSGLVLVLLVYTLRSLRLAERIKLPVYYSSLALLLLIAGVTANRNAFELIAEPQGSEWDMVHNAVMRTNFKPDTKVYLVTPKPEDRSTDRMFADEFGSLSADSDWVPKEMFKAAIKDRFGNKMPKGTGYTFTSGRDVPEPKTYDLVIDLRKLKHLRLP